MLQRQHRATQHGSQRTRPHGGEPDYCYHAGKDNHLETLNNWLNLGQRYVYGCCGQYPYNAGTEAKPEEE